MSEAKKLTTQEQDYSQWYLDVIEAAQLAETSIVRGCMVIRPYGYAIWEGVQGFLDKRFKQTGHENAYFPLFIPKSLLSREADHVKGFAKECAVVTHHRLIESPDGKGVVVDPDAKLGEELIVRPTSETIMYETYSKWVNSWRDLPVMINQWNNVVRWELRTRPFLRTAEFLWQEGHTVHETEDQAEAEVMQMLGIYQELCKNILAVPVIPGRKSENEKFAGALRTFTIEGLMQDGKALQCGTSHNLGQNFAKAFEVKFAARDGSTQYAWQTSWGLSTRIIGALIMSHSDDKGLVLPPAIAPTQVVIVPIFKEENQEAVMAYATSVSEKLQDLNIEYAGSVKQDLRVKLDSRDFESPGRKFNEWEKKGIPVRIEVGPRDMEAGNVVMVRRDTGEKQVVALKDLASTITTLLPEMQAGLLTKAQARVEANTHDVDNYEDFKKVLIEKKGFVRAFWCGDADSEAKIKAETKATSRCLPLDAKEESGTCIFTGKPASHRWLFAVAY